MKNFGKILLITLLSLSGIILLIYIINPKTATDIMDNLSPEPEPSGDSRETEDPLPYLNKVTENRIEFGRKVAAIAKSIGGYPQDLMRVMNAESGMDHRIVNSVSNATGLIQFMPSTAKGLGTTVEALRKMTNLQQLDYVEKYYKIFKSKFPLDSAYKLYLATFYPYAIGKPDSYVLGSEVSPDRVALIAKQNPVIDVNKDGKITVADFRNYVEKVKIRR